jgi:hypothetical protein
MIHLALSVAAFLFLCWVACCVMFLVIAAIASFRQSCAEVATRNEQRRIEELSARLRASLTKHSLRRRHEHQ